MYRRLSAEDKQEVVEGLSGPKHLRRLIREAREVGNMQQIVREFDEAEAVILQRKITAKRLGRRVPKGMNNASKVFPERKNRAILI